MPDETFISIEEAVNLTGKSQNTIRERLIKTEEKAILVRGEEVPIFDTLNDAGRYQTNQKIIKVRISSNLNKSPKWHLSKSWLAKKYPTNEEGSGGVVGTKNNNLVGERREVVAPKNREVEGTKNEEVGATSREVTGTSQASKQESLSIPERGVYERLITNLEKENKAKDERIKAQDLIIENQHKQAQKQSDELVVLLKESNRLASQEQKLRALEMGLDGSEEIKKEDQSETPATYEIPAQIIDTEKSSKPEVSNKESKEGSEKEKRRGFFGGRFRKKKK